MERVTPRTKRGVGRSKKEIWRRGGRTLGKENKKKKVPDQENRNVRWKGEKIFERNRPKKGVKRN